MLQKLERASRSIRERKREREAKRGKEKEREIRTAVHKHPADQRRRGALVERKDALIAHRLGQTGQRAAEPRGRRRLQPDLDGVERVADCEKGKDKVSAVRRASRMSLDIPASFEMPENIPATKPL